jgi:purine-binding chemotaxis protein CheW
MDEKRRAIEDVIQSREDLKPMAEIDADEIQFVIVTLGDQLYAFFGSSVTSIAKVRDIVPIPGTPDHVLGVMYHQGRVESVIDVKRILHLDDTPITGKSRVALATSGELQCGLLVDTVEDVVELPARGVYAPLDTIDPALREFVTGETDYRERNVVILDLVRMFARVLEQDDGAP